jgi:hypothetical protein
MQRTQDRALWLLLVGFALAGCAHETRSTAPAAGGSSVVADTPGNAVRVLEYAVNHRDVDAIDRLLTDDFGFVTPGTDSSGNAARESWTRDTFFAALRALLVGSPEGPPAEQITLLFDRYVVPFPDTRPGKNPRWHKSVRTSLDLKVRIDSGSTVEVTGSALFFLTRGDSAQIPPGLIARGLRPDSTRWWMDRLEDETLAGPGQRSPMSAPKSTHPSQSVTLGRVLSLWLPTTWR